MGGTVGGRRSGDRRCAQSFGRRGARRGTPTLVARGEVWWYEHPRAGRRPFLILTRDEAIPVLNQVLAIPVSRTVRGIPTEVPLGLSDGMPSDCVLTLDNVTLVRVALCTDRITRLRPDQMRDVCEALLIAANC